MKRIHVVVMAAVVLIALVVSYAWNRWISHEVGHDIPSTPSSMGPASEPKVPSATGHMPPRHHGLIHGTKGDDVLYGTESGERIEALAGDDEVFARGGHDVLDGGVGADRLMGGPGNDTYVLQHHGSGGDILFEEGGTDTLAISGSVAVTDLVVTRHGDDLFVRWSRDNPIDIVMIRSWFEGPEYRIERVSVMRGTIVPLEPLAMRAREATSEDLVHFPSSRTEPARSELPDH